ncbi:hypothetical protein ACIPK8_16040 [Enterobacter bugandensis]|uniref:hypothetical protein n=1 Tax=Enterobacter bugandensis TaxID=881260 RepID=UPI0037FF6C9B
MIFFRRILKSEKHMTLNSKHNDWRDMLMNQQDINALKNFDFLARSFARMHAQPHFPRRDVIQHLLP